MSLAVGGIHILREGIWLISQFHNRKIEKERGAAFLMLPKKWLRYFRDDANQKPKFSQENELLGNPIG